MGRRKDKWLWFWNRKAKAYGGNSKLDPKQNSGGFLTHWPTISCLVLRPISSIGEKETNMDFISFQPLPWLDCGLELSSSEKQGNLPQTNYLNYYALTAQSLNLGICRDWHHSKQLPFFQFWYMIWFIGLEKSLSKMELNLVAVSWRVVLSPMPLINIPTEQS